MANPNRLSTDSPHEVVEGSFLTGIPGHYTSLGLGLFSLTFACASYLPLLYDFIPSGLWSPGENGIGFNWGAFFSGRINPVCAPLGLGQRPSLDELDVLRISKSTCACKLPFR